MAAFFGLLSAILFCASVLMPKRYSSVIKDRLLDYYIRIESIDQKEETARIVASLRGWISRKKRYYVILFLFASFVVILSTIFHALFVIDYEPKKLSLGYSVVATEEMQIMFNNRTLIARLQSMGDDICQITSDDDYLAWREVYARSLEIINGNNEWIEANGGINGFFSRLVFAFSATFFILIITTILLIPLLISFYFTIIILNFISLSFKKISFIFLIDHFAAIAIPNLLLGLFFYKVSFFGPLQHIAGIIFWDVPSGPISIGMNLIYIDFLFLLGHLEVANLWIIFANYIEGGYFGNIFQGVIIVLNWIKSNVFNFFYSIRVLFSEEVFRIPYARAILNWMLSVSFIYSLSYIFPVIGFLILKNSSLLREMLLNLIQYIVDNDNSPIFVIATIFGALAAILVFR